MMFLIGKSHCYSKVICIRDYILISVPEFRKQEANKGENMKTLFTTVSLIKGIELAGIQFKKHNYWTSFTDTLLIMTYVHTYLNCENKKLDLE